MSLCVFPILLSDRIVAHSHERWSNNMFTGDKPAMENRFEQIVGIVGSADLHCFIREEKRTRHDVSMADGSRIGLFIFDSETPHIS